MIKKYRIVQNNVILHDGLDEDEAQEGHHHHHQNTTKQTPSVSSVVLT